MAEAAFKPIRIYADGKLIDHAISVDERAMSIDAYVPDGNGNLIAGADGIVTQTIVAQHEIRLVRG